MSLPSGSTERFVIDPDRIVSTRDIVLALRALLRATRLPLPPADIRGIEHLVKRAT